MYETELNLESLNAPAIIIPLVSNGWNHNHGDYDNWSSIQKTYAFMKQ